MASSMQAIYAIYASKQSIRNAIFLCHLHRQVWARLQIRIITSAKEIMLSLLSVCSQDISKGHKPILMKLSGIIGHVPWTNRFVFEQDTDVYVYPASSWKFLYHGRLRKTEDCSARRRYAIYSFFLVQSCSVIQQDQLDLSWIWSHSTILNQCLQVTTEL